MGWKRKLAIIGYLAVGYATLADGAALRGGFVGASLQFDAQIESPEVNSGVSTVALLAPGQSVEVQMFISEAAGKETLGYSIEFAEATRSLFTITGVDFTGAPLSGESGKPVLSALLIGQPTIPDNGYIGTLNLIAKTQIDEGSIIRSSYASLADPSAEGDELDLSRAAILFTADHYVAGLVGDLDRDGDVDFRDFLTFAVNYGKSGPVPSERVRLVTIVEPGGTSGGDTDTVVVTLVDTLKQTIRDTIFQTRTDTLTNSIVVLDTVYVSQQQDTLTIRDSIFVEVRDTIIQVQTVVRRDTITVTQPGYVGGEERRPSVLPSWGAVVDSVEETVYWVGVTQEPTAFNSSPDLIFVGTAFAVDVGVIATNAHVGMAVFQVMSNIRALGAIPVPMVVQANVRSFVSGTFPLIKTEDGSSIVGIIHPQYDLSLNSPDIALLFFEAPSSLKFAHLLPTKLAKALDTGDEIATLGFPGELEQVVSRFSSRIPTLKTGNISALRPYSDFTTVHRITNRIVQHDFNTTPGTSGSPVFNKRGEVVAVHYSGFQGGSLGFAIRADELRELLEALSIEFSINLANAKPVTGASPMLLGQLVRAAGYGIGDNND